MAANHVGVLPVIDSLEKQKLCGLITQFELLAARDRILQEERKRERILKLWPIYKAGSFNGIGNIFPWSGQTPDKNDKKKDTLP
jgi:hypothetical protein